MPHSENWASVQWIMSPVILWAALPTLNLDSNRFRVRLGAARITIFTVGAGHNFGVE